MFQMVKLPFALDALVPFISQRTMDYHYNKHYKGYVDKLNELAKDTKFEKLSLEETVKESYKSLAEDRSIYNNAAQVWNHEFFWHSLQLSAKEKKDIKSLVQQTFGSVEEFKRKFKAEALAQFGSGWCWLAEHEGKAEITKTSNADNLLLRDNYKPLLCIDVWEHAYYLDYQNRRGDFVAAFLDNLF